MSLVYRGLIHETLDILDPELISGRNMVANFIDTDSKQGVKISRRRGYYSIAVAE